jgi:hypothetical protein
MTARIFNMDHDISTTGGISPSLFGVRIILDFRGDLMTKGNSGEYLGFKQSKLVLMGRTLVPK